MISGQDESVNSGNQSQDLMPVAVRQPLPAVQQSTVSHQIMSDQQPVQQNVQLNLNIPANYPRMSDQEIEETIVFTIRDKVREFKRKNHWWTGCLISLYYIVIMWSLNQVETKFLQTLFETSQGWFFVVIVILPGLVVLFFIVWWRTSDWQSDKYRAKLITAVTKRIQKHKQMKGIPKTDLARKVQQAFERMGTGGAF